MQVMGTLMVFALCAVAFGLGWMARSQAERKRAVAALHQRRITQIRRTPARPGTTPSVVRKAQLDRSQSISTVNLPSNVGDRRK